jgi:hypothetical protein
MKLISLFFFAALVALSCKPKAAETETETVEVETTTEAEVPAELQAYEDQIMKIHDEVMPKMGDINRLRNELKSIKDKSGTTPMPGLDDAIQALDKAEEWMMTWMKNYSETKNTLAPEHLGKFYEKELMKVENVKSTMLTSIEQAEAWLAAHPAG